MLLFICFDAALLWKRDRELFHDLFNVRVWLTFIILILIFSAGGWLMKFIRADQWLVVSLLSFFPFFLLRRHAFAKAWILKYKDVPPCEGNLALASETLALVLYWCAGMVVTILALKMGERLLWFLRSHMAQMVTLSLVSSIWMMILIYFMARKCSHLDYASLLGVNRTSRPWYIIWLIPAIGGLGCAVLTTFLSLARSYQPKTPFYELLTSTDSSGSFWAFFMVAVVLAPFFEELIFRGFFFYVIDRIKGKIFAVVSIALVFALLHYDQYWGDWLAIVVVTFLGFFLTLLRAWTGTSIASMVMHYSFNGGMASIPLIVVYLTNPVYFDYQVRYNDLNSNQKEQFLLESIYKYPKHATSYNDLAWLYAEENRNFDEALTLADQALYYEPRNFAFLDTKSEILYKMGDYQQALEIAQSLIKRYPRDQYIRQQFEKFSQALIKNTEVLMER